ncbi:MAG: GDSL-type esterase/lipase family protein [Fimbriimonadaceae bacterium]
MNLISVGMAVVSSFALHSGDRVVFYGDSITEQRRYTTLVEAFVRTRYPNLGVKFFSRGWGGDASWGGGGGTIEQRVSQDVAPLKPTVISVLLGMNDGGYVAYDSKVASTINDWYGKLLDLMAKSAPQARFTCIETCPWDQYAHDLPPGPPKPDAWAPWDGYNDVLVRYGDEYKKQAARIGATFVDFNAPLVSVLKAAHLKDPVNAMEIVPDSIHPGPAGALVMAGALVGAWGIEPLVSSVRIDVGAKTVTGVRTTVSHLTGMAWDQLDASLPLPIPSASAAEGLAWSVSGLDDGINVALLQVIGLTPGRYHIEIDRKLVGFRSAAELAAGVNIGGALSPMRAQALKVLDLVQQRSDLDYIRWRTMQREHGDLSAAKDAIKAIDRMEDELLEAERKAALPVTHHYELKKAPA